MAARICLLASVVVSALAAGAIEAAVQEGPTRARAAYDRALALEQAGDHAGALSLLWEAAGLAPRDADILTRLGDALERLGALDAAVDAYRRAFVERPDDSRVSDRLILTLVKAGKGDEAVARARTRAAARPEDPGRQFTLGLALAEQDVTAAIATFRRVIELAPRHTLARYNLALVLKRSDRLQDAADELRRSIAIEPRAEAFYTLGVIRWHQGDTDGATDAMREALGLQPRYADAHFTLGAILKETRDWKGAAAALRQAIALRPELWSARYTLARVLELSGDAKAARTELAEAERVRQRAQLEHEALVWTSVGIERLDAGDPARALEHFRRATGAFEAYAPAHYHAGHALARLGRQEEARAAFARARQLNPGLVPPRDAR